MTKAINQDGYETYVAPETHEEKMERLRMQEEYETKRSKNRLREARQKTYQIVGIAVAGAAVIIAIATLIYLGSRGPDKPDYEQQREESCIQHGGGWVPSNLLSSQEEKGLCVYPGRTSSDG